MSGATVTETTEQDQARFLGRIEYLRQLMEKNIPGYEEMLKQIHRNLSADENLVHILDEAQIGVIITGLAKRKNVVIATSLAKGSGGKKAIKSLEDFE